MSALQRSDLVITNFPVMGGRCQSKIIYVSFPKCNSCNSGMSLWVGQDCEVFGRAGVQAHNDCTVFLHSCRFLCYPPLDKNETALHCREGRFFRLLHEKRGLLGSLSGDTKGGQHWRKTEYSVTASAPGQPPVFQPFSQISHTPIVSTLFQIGPCGAVEDDLEEWLRPRERLHRARATWTRVPRHTLLT